MKQEFAERTSMSQLAPQHTSRRPLQRRPTILFVDNGTEDSQKQGKHLAEQLLKSIEARLMGKNPEKKVKGPKKGK